MIVWKSWTLASSTKVTRILKRLKARELRPSGLEYFQHIRYNDIIWALLPGCSSGKRIIIWFHKRGLLLLTPFWDCCRLGAEEKRGSAKQLCRRIRQGKAGGKSHEDHHRKEGRLDADRHRFIKIL